jgi:hypothetical protein
VNNAHGSVTTLPVTEETTAHDAIRALLQAGSVTGDMDNYEMHTQDGRRIPPDQLLLSMDLTFSQPIVVHLAAACGGGMMLKALIVEQLEADGTLRSLQMKPALETDLVVAFADEYDEPREGPFH